MSATCPNGHDSQAEDFCDTCGAKIEPDAVTPASSPPEHDPEPESEPDREPAAAPAQQACPNCATANTADALFCEACGYDFTTGALPRGAAPVGAEGNVSTPLAPAWVAEVWVDPHWYEGQDAEEPIPSPGLPAVVTLANRSNLIGRVSASLNITPDIDCTTDTGVSRRHAQLTTDGRRWFVEDLASSNGTFVGPASGPLPEEPIAVGPRTELDDDDRIYVGAWTRIVVRQATPDEVAAQQG